MKVALLVLSLISCALAFNLKPSFDRFDGNKDGYISTTEWNLLYSAFDENNDGKVSPEEFVKSWVVLTGLSPSASLQLFFLMDENSNNFEEINEHINSFRAMDTNRDGLFSFKEYVQAMSNLSEVMVDLVKIQTVMTARFARFDTSPKDGLLSIAELSSLYSEADRNGDRQITEPEFVAYWEDGTKRSKANARYIFNMLDANNNGVFDYNGSDLASVFDGFDYNKDGVVSKDELKSALNSVHAEMVKDSLSAVAGKF